MIIVLGLLWLLIAIHLYTELLDESDAHMATKIVVSVIGTPFYVVVIIWALIMELRYNWRW